MGTDIHLEVEVLRNGKWCRVPHQLQPCCLCDGAGRFREATCDECKGNGLVVDRFYRGRNYVVFGVLAGIRSNMEPIDEPRGLPADSEITERSIFRDADSEHLTNYMGDHSHSWVTLQEIDEYDWSVITDEGTTIAECCEEFLEAMDRIRHFHPDPNCIRLVFGFDS